MLKLKQILNKLREFRVTSLSFPGTQLVCRICNVSCLLVSLSLKRFRILAFYESTCEWIYTVTAIITLYIFISDGQDDCNIEHQRETSRAARRFTCIFPRIQPHIIRYQLLHKHVVTRVQTHPFPPGRSVTLSPSVLFLSPFDHRRSTIDASSLAASVRIYGNVYVGRSYIRGFWRIAYIREILITWPTRRLPRVHAYVHTISEGVRSFLRQRKYATLANGTVLRALLTFRLSAFRPIYLPSSLPFGISFRNAQCLTF